jgi:ketosteroid isomerase-like protein
VGALAEFYRAFNTRDLALMEHNWYRSSEASMDNPLGGIKRGWDEIRSVYQRIFTSKASVHVEFHDYTLHCIPQGMYFTLLAGNVAGSANGTELDLTIRTTRVFRRFGGRWQQVHHHGSIDDPQLLAAYQAAVR